MLAAKRSIPVAFAMAIYLTVTANARADESRPQNRLESQGRDESIPEAALARLGNAMRHGNKIHISALAPDGKTLATVGERDVVLWDLKSGKIVRRLPCDRESSFYRPGLAFSPDGLRLVHSRNNEFAQVWDL